MANSFLAKSFNANWFNANWFRTHGFYVALLAVLCAAFLTAASNVNAERPLEVAGYLPDYRLAEWSGELGGVTDLIYFGMSAPTDGKFDASSISETAIQKLRRIKKLSPIRLLFTVGGWGKSEGFVRLTADDQTRVSFVGEAMKFCQSAGFDGIDYDWEHPQGKEQLEAYQKLICETHRVFAPAGLRVTVAQAGWQDIGTAAYQCVDRIHLMAYDHGFPHATFAKGTSDVQRLIDAGCPKEKLLLGVPFYGRSAEGNAKAYAELILSDQLSNKHIDQANDESVIDGYAFNSQRDVRNKARFARQKGLAGIMIWELSQDASTDASLLKTIQNESETSSIGEPEAIQREAISPGKR